MNRRRSCPAENRVKIIVLFWIMIVVASIAASATYNVYLVNQGIEIERLVRAQEDLAIQYENDARDAEVKIADQLGYFEIKDKLAALQSNLKPITKQQLIVLNETVAPREIQSIQSLAQLHFYKPLVVMK